MSINNPHDILTVMAHRCGGDGYPNVCLNVYVRDVDVDVYLTPGQARLLAESLVAVARTVEGTEYLS